MFTLLPLMLPVMTAKDTPLGSSPLPLSDPELSVITKSCSAAPPPPQQSHVPVLLVAASAPVGASATHSDARATSVNASAHRRTVPMRFPPVPKAASSYWKRAGTHS